ncbi:MAG: hypothetical protein A3C16_01905 [Candidatus Sungbacteria bacterium RIFCSPHIGHO2_02_FULL_51_29]|uniref:Uncharacterized protein n=1 Tax=Candidatus Sungbacteria bacterium RIFCSPHIGHO2_02_FULL_51_29 TaxID=1802273 RepID=A0A1G2KPF0_9BACT|nr:MAG: hypothetical protein A3C16_01905 [Candidatus Sungbacteria bacterium RIFCSPHIGHO2_02_FULL_51_29]
MRKIALLAVFVAVLAFVGLVDAATLLPGEYSGTWVFRGMSGNFYLTISSINGSMVAGEVLSMGTPVPVEKFENGVLEGSVLTIKLPSRLIKLAIGEDGGMTGTSSNDMGEAKLERLKKKK